MTSNVTSETQLYVTERQLIIIKVMCIVTTLLGTVTNSITIFAILKGRLYINASYIFILNLSVCNFLHCIIFHPLLAVQAFHGIWTDNASICNAYSFGLFSNLGTEMWGYILITLNRYICVVQYHRYTEIYGNARNICLQLLFSWLFYPIVFLLPLVGAWGQYQYAPQKLVCHPFVGYHCEGFCLFVYVCVLTTTVPVILVSYSAIIFTYMRSQKKIGIGRDKSINRSMTSERVKSDSERQRSFSELKMAFTILAVILVFGCFRLPFILLYLFDPSMSKVEPIVHTVLIYIGANSNWINPIIYALTNKQIFETLRKSFPSWRSTLVIQKE